MTHQFDGLPFGIHASTGRPLDTRNDGVDVTTAQAEEKKLESITANIPVNIPSAGMRFGGAPNDLAYAGWGLIFAANVDASPYLDALAELLAMRRQQAGEKFRIFAGPDGYRPGETASKWLNRHGAALNMIDPDRKVPYYLAIVGPPTDIPFEFQYALDIVAGVGRLDFASLAELQAYAHSVASFESNTDLVTARQLELFATCHDFDRATQLFTKNVAEPFSAGTPTTAPLGTQLHFSVNPTLREHATKETLARILSKEIAPSILFTGTHGMAFDLGDERQQDNQGALVCQDWPGYGNISEEHWFAASDVPANANVHGLMHFFFACYGAGTPEYDNFLFKPTNVRIGEAPRTARLPQKLMSLPQGGVLASLGHIDRAWATSFQTQRGVSQTQGFQDVILQLMAGHRVGYATDQFNGQWGVLSTELADILQNKAYGKEISDADLLAIQIARDDCRNYVVLGDPAVRLRPQPL